MFERGDESELMFAAFYSVLIEIWRGNFTEATQGGGRHRTGRAAGRRLVALFFVLRFGPHRDLRRQR